MHLWKQGNEAPDALWAECVEEQKRGNLGVKQGTGSLGTEISGETGKTGSGVTPGSPGIVKTGEGELCRACGRKVHAAESCFIVEMKHPDRNQNLSVTFAESDVGKKWKLVSTHLL